MAAKKNAKPGNVSSMYRRARAMKGCRRVDVILSSNATLALSALERGGLTATKAVCDGLMALAKQKGLK